MIEELPNHLPPPSTKLKNFLFNAGGPKRPPPKKEELCSFDILHRYGSKLNELFVI